MTTNIRPTESSLTEEERITEMQNYLNVLFHEEDYITFRPMESWIEDGKKKTEVIYPEVTSVPKQDAVNPEFLSHLLEVSSCHLANMHVGVCPRSGSEQANEEFEFQWQIPGVNALWADIDNTSSIDELGGRLEAARIPVPTMIVSSGNGLHAYWALDEPFQTNANPWPVTYTWSRIDGQSKKMKRIIHPDGDIALHDPETGQSLRPPQIQLTPEANGVKAIVKGIGQSIRGDHTHDLSRLLRLPGTPNRKNQRNGAEPTECRIIQYEPDCVFSIENFSHLSAPAPRGRASTAEITVWKSQPSRAQRPARSPQTAAATSGRFQLSTRTPADLERSFEPPAESPVWAHDFFDDLLDQCDQADIGERSEKDFAVCCFGAKMKFSSDALWPRCARIGKFAERGRSYFDTTWENAVKAVANEPPFESEAAAMRSLNRTVIIQHNEKHVNTDVINRIANETDIFVYNGTPARIVREDEHRDSMKIIGLKQAALREQITASVDFIRRDKSGDLSPSSIPPYCAAAILERGAWPRIRHLKGISLTPVLRTDGTVAQDSGYDPESQLYLNLKKEFPRVPPHPTHDTAVLALNRLLEIFADFHFTSNASRSAALAALLTPFARELYQGPTSPLFLVSAAQPGVGKSLLVNVLSTIVTGRSASCQAFPGREEEVRKLITSHMLCPSPYLVFDNVSGELGASALDAALTGGEWQDRILGSSSIAQGQLRSVFMATGNNVRLTNDLARRVCPIRLETTLQHPDQRSDFQHSDLTEYVQQNRAQFVVDCLTILRAYYKDEQPNQNLPKWGSFEAWSSVVRNTLVWLGQADPSDGRSSVREEDETIHSLHDFLRQFGDVLRATEQPDFTAAELHRLCTSNSHPGVPSRLRQELTSAIEGLADKSFAEIPKRSLGKVLGRYKERVVQGRRLVYSNSGSRRAWTVAEVRGS